MSNVSDITALITISHCRKEIVITLRGSQNAWNVVLSSLALNVQKDDTDPNIKMHLGIYIATMSLYNEVS